jgi:hypothetical protein
MIAMALKIDTSRALRTHKQLTELVEAVLVAAKAEPETHAVEWKSKLDLASEAEARFKLAKQVIAFSNRHPDDAAREFEGCAYIVIGAEPQALPTGVPVHDPAALDDWIGPFVGSDGPRWKADYVKVRDRAVLVVTVEAPRWGDPIQLLQKQFGNFGAGRPFVRRQGKAVEPDQHGMRMLEERLKRVASRIQVGVEFGGGRPTFLTYKTSASNEWAKWMGAERERLYKSSELETPQPTGTTRDTVRGPLALRSLNLSSLQAIAGERRSQRTYEREVEEYLARARDTWHQLIWEDAIEKRLADLELRLTNPTDQNYADVQVVITMPPAVHVFTDDDGPRELLNPPEPPAPWGTVGLEYPPSFVRSHPVLRERAAVSVGDSWTVTFPAVDLRPHQTMVLPAAHLVIPEAIVDSDIEIRWAATSTSASGLVRGALSASIAPGGVLISLLPAQHA